MKFEEFRTFLREHGITCATPKELVKDERDGVKHYELAVHPLPGKDVDFEFERADIGFIGVYVDTLGHLGEPGKCYLDSRQGDWPRIKQTYLLAALGQEEVQAIIEAAIAKVRAIPEVIAIAGNPRKLDTAIYVPALVRVGDSAQQVTYIVYKTATGKVEAIPQITTAV